MPRARPGASLSVPSFSLDTEDQVVLVAGYAVRGTQ